MLLDDRAAEGRVRRAIIAGAAILVGAGAVAGAGLGLLAGWLLWG